MIVYLLFAGHDHYPDGGCEETVFVVFNAADDNAAIEIAKKHIAAANETYQEYADVDAAEWIDLIAVDARDASWRLIDWMEQPYRRDDRYRVRYRA